MKSVSILWNLGPDNTDCHTKNMSARLSMDHPPFGGQALQHQANFCSHAQGSIFIITFLLHHGNRGLWRAAPKETGTKSRSGSAPGQTDRRRQRRRGRPPASTREVRDFFLKSRPHRRGPSSGAAPAITAERWPRPAGGRCPSAAITRYSCRSNKCQIPPS